MRILYLTVLLFALVSQITLAQRKEKISDPRASNDLQWEVVAKKANVSVYRDRDCTNKISDLKLNFKDQFYVVGFKNDESGKPYSLELELGKSRQRYAWVKAEDLLLSNKSLKESNISVKATVVNYYKKTRPQSNYYDAPNQGRLLGEARWYHIYFVYDVYYGEGVTYDEHDFDKAQYLLLGTDPKYNPTSVEKGPDNVLLGWFEKSNNGVVIWNTRIGLQPNLTRASKREKKEQQLYGSVFTSNSHAVRWYDDAAYDPKTLISSDQLLVEKDYELKDLDYRMPVIKKSTVSKKGNRMSAYRVAYAGNTIFNQRKLQNTQREIQSTKKVNVLYVVDATKTMCKYLTDLPEAIRYASNAVNKEFPSYELKWGLAVFRNKVDQGERFEFIGQTGQVKVLESFTREISCGSRSTELPEDLFRGTQAAVTQFFNASNDGIRVTITISDVKGDLSVYGASPQELGKALKGSGSHFFAINVGNDYQSDFRNQMQEVVQTMNGHRQRFINSTDKDNAQRFYYMDPSEGGEELQGAYVEVNNKIYYKDILFNLLLQIVNGVNNSYMLTLFGTAGSTNTLKADEITNIETDFDFTFPMSFGRDFRKYEMSNQQVGVYYTMGSVINEHKRLREVPFEPVALLSRNDIRTIYDVADELVSLIEDPNMLNLLAQVKTLLELYSGEKGLYRDIRELRKVSKELPIAPGIIQELEKNGTQILTRMSKSRLQQFHDRLVKKRDNLRTIYQAMNDDQKSGFMLGSSLYRWVKLSDLP